MNFIFVLSALGALAASGLAVKLKEIEISTFQDSVRASTVLGRIVNGQPATENQIPHQCAILSPVGNGFSVCGGSIISAGWVLTAAHCTVGYSQHNLRFGSIALTSGGQVQTAFGAISHPQYNSVNMNYDISVIEIPSPLTFTVAIQSIRLPTNSQINSTFVDASAVVSGWGSTFHGGDVSQTLNWANMRVISNSVCMNTFGGAVVVEHVVCATGASGPTQGHCGGDSGGPLSIVEAGIPTLIGVVSFGASSGCHLPYPSGYMRTANFIHWINEKTSIPVRP
ncbi:Serine protease 3 [Pseudolycoriella hygida]|uniref:Serine protease 3 n=1 Tax=Pseudolycoriella hygida TaxID=35572 RepID=A0A9Q0S3F7_9DIPT|nr:Serine protease 3 [Pseudolycoriella hygida]